MHYSPYLRTCKIDDAPAARRRALATAREIYLWIVETGIGARELVDVMEPAA